jgi:hypothetical protein
MHSNGIAFRTSTLASLSAPLGGMTPSSQGNGIRNVDFLNFDYPTEMGVVHVSKGKWKEVKGEENYLRVLNVAYGDFKGSTEFVDPGSSRLSGDETVIQCFPIYARISVSE